MKVAYVASYPPRACGIATFTEHLVEAIGMQGNISPVVIALNDGKDLYDYPAEVMKQVEQQNLDDYLAAADFINNEGIDLCIIEHEFGIFGGENGIYILPFIARLKVPVIVTFHTILKDPNFMQRTIIHQVGLKADAIVVMSQLAIQFLQEIYGVPAGKINFIEHGVPDFTQIEYDFGKMLPGFEGKKMLFTFGLLSRNKGIETVIKALPKIIQQYPDTVYVIAGSTHPGVIRHSGEEYRESLHQLVQDLELREHVIFLNKFLTEKELCIYLKRCDLYITPYLSEAQITSGTLTYALGAGAVVLSTPYWYAKELLAGERGYLFPFKDSQTLAACVLQLFNNPGAQLETKQRAITYGQHLQWRSMGQRYLQLARLTIQNYHKQDGPTSLFTQVPALNLAHVRRLSDSTGIVQHAKYGIPNLKEGYCLDDNSRALMMLLMAGQFRKIKDVQELLPVYLSFIHYMQRPDGNFRNFLGFNRRYLDDIGSEDSFGRTVWALGYLIRYAPNHSYREFALELFHRSVPHFKQLEHLRGHANTIIGICQYLHYYPSDEGMYHVLQPMVDKLVNAFFENNEPGWQWFEPRMTYDNGILPLALLHAYQVMPSPVLKDVAMQALSFLELVTFKNEYFQPVGNDGWFEKNGIVPRYDQQAVETMAMVLLYQQAQEVTAEDSFTQKMYSCFEWFLGKNSLFVPLYDSQTHGCCDGLQEAGLNRNQGAESTLAFIISQLCVLKAMESTATSHRNTMMMTHSVTYNGLIHVSNR
ncbi:glycosyl transferase [Chitinophaga caeni]|uniref:Glycosyl transferase n=1 Tax=Chitinophaga caeni TaxID=2029983 RepID=A0A291QYD1_9BACT|nr:glycosyltransferase family 4 protein [Chitinophaga caeni]ATL49029.1 glycosyl transferase [Chitinophaga caeni]